MSSDPHEVRAQVRKGYARIATSGAALPLVDVAGGCCGGGTCTPAELAEKIGYAPEELQWLPEGANLGLSCGNPSALASLAPGEVVLDLGSGAGFDAFLAAPKVGPTGRVIGVDMTPDMLNKARQNAKSFGARGGLANVEFRLGEIEHLPLGDATVDVVISNCVLNLSPDKPQVWREIARVLRPGGRVSISDLALLKPLPASIASRIEALIGCIAGAALVSEMEQMVRAAGLANVQLELDSRYVDALKSLADPLLISIAQDLDGRPQDYVTNLLVTAEKPR